MNVRASEIKLMRIADWVIVEEIMIFGIIKNSTKHKIYVKLPNCKDVKRMENRL